MTCPRHNRSGEHTPPRDQNLLLLAHGALPFWPRLRIQAHLRCCAACQGRLARLVEASALLAETIRGPSLPAWTRRGAVSKVSPPVSHWLLIALALIILAVALCLVTLNLRARTKSAAPPRPAANGCRPDLPNSRCR